MSELSTATEIALVDISGAEILPIREDATSGLLKLSLNRLKTWLLGSSAVTVDISGATDGQALLYDLATTTFKPGDVAGGGGGGGGSTSGPTNLGTMRPLTDFTPVNISSSRSLVEVAGKAITALDTSPGGAVRVFGISRAAPTPPYRVAMFIQDDNANINYGGFAFGWSDGTKIDHCMNGADLIWYNEQLSNPTTRSSITGLSARRYTPSAGGLWVGCRDDGTNVFFEISSTGVYWATVLKKVKSSGFLGGSGYSNIFVGQWEEASPSGTDNPMATTIREYDEAGLSRAF